MNKTGKRRFLRLGLIVLFWLCVWQGASMAVDNSILLVGPRTCSAPCLHR